jgi:hypothetical protein
MAPRRGKRKHNHEKCPCRACVQQGRTTPIGVSTIRRHMLQQSVEEEAVAAELIYIDIEDEHEE